MYSAGILYSKFFSQQMELNIDNLKTLFQYFHLQSVPNVFSELNEELFSFFFQYENLNVNVKCDDDKIDDCHV